MKKTIALPLMAAAALLAGCGSMGGKPADASMPSTPTQAADGTLIGPKGMTLYTFAKDVKGSGASACYDACAANWPPLGVAANARPLGDYSIIIRQDGTRQWAYKGMPLYYFAKDGKPGDKMGNGLLGGAWKVATP